MGEVAVHDAECCLDSLVW